ncbi:glycoside hydrolase family 65 protein [bacterium]|nr:glycoside hydrolase family 65 protein [bacterium]
MFERLWTLKEYPFHAERLHYFETIFSIGNGYLGTRGSFEEGYQDATPATLIHGLYNHAAEMSVPELVNVPDWTALRITVDDTPFSLITKSTNALNPPAGLVFGYERKLHLDRGLLRRVVLFRAATGATVRVVFERFASLADVHTFVQRVHINAIDGTPQITIEALLDGDVTNDGVQHWVRMQAQTTGEDMALAGETSQSRYRLAMASRLSGPAPAAYSASGRSAAAKVTLQLEKDGEATFDKFTSIYTSRDTADPLIAAKEKAVQAAQDGYDALLAAHQQAWRERWDAVDIEIEGDEYAQLGVRFATYHILIAAPNPGIDASIGAKTLSGLGYKGHVFWDTELFMLPPFTLALPEIARNMLMYRYHRLEGARQKARENGFEGGDVPLGKHRHRPGKRPPQWSDPLPPFGERIRIWTGDNEQHISTDIAYAVLQYWRWTGDDAFLKDYGAEIVLDTAVFWGSRVQALNGRYELHEQIGPDEYHENIRNSVFVNRMVVWHLQEALNLLAWLHAQAPEAAAMLTQQLDLSEARLAKWRDIIGRMYIPFDEERQIHVQFDGFFDLEYIPVPKYEPRVGGIWGYLGHERALASQVIKQADVVMLMARAGGSGWLATSYAQQLEYVLSAHRSRLVAQPGHACLGCGAVRIGGRGLSHVRTRYRH